MPNYESPDLPIYRFGKPSMQVESEALQQQDAHEQWHAANPGEPCSPSDWPMSSYDDIYRGGRVRDLAGGGTICPGDSFVESK